MIRDDKEVNFPVDYPAKYTGKSDRPQPETFEQAVDITLAELREILLSKRRDYGSGNIEAFGEIGVLVRVSDKFARLKNLLYDNPGEPQNETIEDTWADLSNYGILAILWRRGDLRLPLEDEEGGND